MPNKEKLTTPIGKVATDYEVAVLSFQLKSGVFSYHVYLLAADGQITTTLTGTRSMSEMGITEGNTLSDVQTKLATWLKGRSELN